MKLKQTKFAFLFLTIILFLQYFLYYCLVFEKWELSIMDSMFIFRGIEFEPPEEIVVVDIDEKSISDLGRLGEWSRSYYSQVIDYLNQGKPRVIGFDIFFPEESRLFPKEDHELALATEKGGNICHSMFFCYRWDRGTSSPIPQNLHKFSYGKCHILGKIGNHGLFPIEQILKKSNSIGYVNISIDTDGIARRIQPLVVYNGDIYPFFSFQMACDYLGIKKDDVKIVPGKFIHLGSKIRIPIDKEEKMLINYRFHSSRHIPFSMILKKEIPAEYFKDRIVLIGGTAAGLFDEVATPINSCMPMVDVHANIIWSIIKNDFISSLEEHVVFVISFILSIIVGLISVFLHPLKGLIIILGLVIGYFIFALCLFEFKGLYFDIVRPILSMLSIRLLFTERALMSLGRKK